MGGPSGWTGAHLAECSSDQIVLDGLTCFIKEFRNGTYDDNISRQLLLSASLIGLSKEDKNDGIRPVAMGEIFYKLVGHYNWIEVINSIANDNTSNHSSFDNEHRTNQQQTNKQQEIIRRLFPRIQFGVNIHGGSAQAAGMINAAINHFNPEKVVVLATDIKNAFNELPKEHIIEQIRRFPFLHPIRKLFDYAYNQPTPLHLYDKNGKLHDTLTSAVGVRQGDVLSSLLFSLAMQPIYESIVDKHNVKAVVVIDDFTLIGEADNIFAALLDFQKQLTNIKLELVLSKCQLLAPPAANKTVQQNIQQQCNNIGIIYKQDNIELLGTIISHNKQQIQRFASDKLKEQGRILRLLGNPQMHKHVALQLLIETVVPTLGYLAQTIDPDDLLEAAVKFDKNTLNTFCTITGIDTVLLSDYKKDQITLPLKKGGYGLQKTARTSPAAYFAILCLILDDVTKEYGPEAAAPIHLRLNSLIDHELKNLGITKHELANLKSNVNLNHILNSRLSRKQSTTEHTQSQPDRETTTKRRSKRSPNRAQS